MNSNTGQSEKTPSGKKMTPSLRKIIRVLMLTLIPVVLTGAAFIIFSLIDTYRQNEEHFRSTVEMQTRDSSDRLVKMNYYLIDLLLNNEQVEKITGAAKDLERNNGARKLWNDMDFQRNFWASDFSFFFYARDSEMSVTGLNYMIPYGDNTALKTHLIGIAHSDGETVNALDWTHIVVNDTVYLYQLYRDGGNYFAAWISAETLFHDLKINPLMEGGHLFFFDDAGTLLTGETDFQALEAAPEDENTRQLFHVGRTHISLFVQSNSYSGPENLTLLITFIAVIMLILLAVSIFTLRYYRRYIELPLLSFQNHISDYAEQKKTQRKGGFAELNNAVEAFDALTEQIRALKIDVYEEKLALTRTELEYYQLQIKPHFFVNCFSIIHGMAQKQDFSRIQEFCIKLSNYVRFLMTDSMGLIPLQSELREMNEYLQIQRIRRKSGASLFDSVDPELLDAEIPPLIILTFVENSIKHGAGETGRDITIDVTVQKIRGQDTDKMQILISDDGVGFPGEIIEAYNSSFTPKEDWRQGEHIGIRNIFKRLFLLYGDKFSLKLRNTGTGSEVEIRIPLLREKAQDDGDF